MAWYYGTYSCGHEGRTNIVGPTKNREWISDRHFEKLCPECWEKKTAEDREKANLDAVEKAKEMELPELIGTEKQVAWANTLRQNVMDELERRLKIINQTYSNNPKLNESLDKINNAIQFMLRNKTSASWYIDNRKIDLEFLLRKIDSEMELEKVDETPEAKEALLEAEVINADSTVYPEHAKYKVPVKIIVKNNIVSAEFEKNEGFRGLVKGLGYSWGDGVWYRELNKFNGSAEDRAAELGNKLLNLGFPIVLHDNIIRQNAVDGKHEQECVRWIQRRSKGAYEGWLTISWGERNNKLYDSARSLPGSKWDSPSVVVKVQYWKEVEDFASMNGFKFSEAALKAVEEEKAKLKTIVSPKKVKKEEEKNGLVEILKSDNEILDDLKDGD